MESVFERVPKQTLYEQTGIQFLPFNTLYQLAGHRIDDLYIVGGGSQSQFLNECTADALQRTVHTGPVEATALGNILVQMITAGDLNSIQQGRDLIARCKQSERF